MTLPGLFVVGTDTGVGKTRVSCAISRALRRDGRRVGVLKPVATGVPCYGDTDPLIEAIGGGVAREEVTPLVFEEPLAPVVAARVQGVRLEQDQIDEAVRNALDRWAGRAEVMVVEGLGGLLSPLAEGTTVADLAIRLDYPLVIVARRGLGTLNHTLLTVEAALRRELRIAGLVLNSADGTQGSLAEATNADELARRLDGIALLAEVPYSDDPLRFDAILARIDWEARALPPRFSFIPTGASSGV